MTSHSHTAVCQIDGSPASPDDLVPLAFAGFAHFTALQVRSHRVRALDLHLNRLQAASRRLFGRSPSSERLRAHVWTAAAASAPDSSMTVTLFSGEGEHVAAEEEEPRVLVRTAPPQDGPRGPMTVALVEHERYLPEVKLVAESAKTDLSRRAQSDGFDDALFVDRRGRISEGTIWNVAFWDGERVVWPSAEALVGTMQATLRRRLPALGVEQVERPVRAADLTSLRGAALMNSWIPAVPLTRIGGTEVPRSPELETVLQRALELEPWEQG